MQNKQVFTGYLISKIAAFDFEKFYTKKNRIFLHLIMWFSFSILLFLSYVLAYQLSYFNALIFTFRMTTVNAMVFYLFFYLFLPKIISGSGSRIFLFLLITFLICIFLWIAVTYCFSIVYHALGFEILTGELKGAIQKSAEQTFGQALSVRRMISQCFIIISILSPFFFVKILFEISRLYNRTLKIQSQKADLEIQNINIEKQFLTAQLNPHFLFNTLNNLYGLSIKKDDSAPEVILNLSDIMSYTLYESNHEKVALGKELEFLKNYIELERMRYSDDKNIQFHFPDDKVLFGYFIPPLLTFTFIENAFKYGLKSNGEHFLILDIKIENDELYFYLENDKEKDLQEKEFGGIGIVNASKRLQLLYPDKHQLKIENFETKFKVALRIDLKN
ncbi:sensor histidine kinase YesM [Flavobacterium sp. HSC-32F16]|uniref:sensor histidine kinase n=1 Tax=Flavobacterium sp. HSC-32F16 TaxID=2910964 RepID=UPI0020A2B59D|nr:sensor histidine kinase [Flavobacterium sp. HSC-32F16]MCP2025447.1 sensor histidine kinase YesM [Flavobacterium sp. HSC-32F16]